MKREDSELVEILAYAYTRNARPDKAAVLLTALDALLPGQGKVLPALALAQVRSGQPQLALGTLDRIAAAGDLAPPWHLLRAQALVACGRRLEAGTEMTAFVSAQHDGAPREAAA